MCLSLLGEGACLACNLCCCLGSAISASRKEQVRTSYITLIVTIMGILFILQEYVNSILDKLDFLITCPGPSTGGSSTGTSLSTCLGVSAIYRFSFALAIMHFIILFACSMRNKMSKAVNEGSWGFKFLALFVLFVLLLYVDNSFFVTYSNIAKVVSGFFLMFQIIMIIDLCYLWGEKWVAIYDEGNSCWAIVMVVATIVLYIITGYLMVWNFGWFTGDGCGSQQTYIIISLVLIVLLSILTVSPIPAQKSIITSGAVSLYIAFLTWSALTNSELGQKDKDGTCNQFADSNKTLFMQICIGTFLFCVTLCYVSYQSSETTSEKVMLTGNINIAAQVLDDTKEDDAQEEGEEGTNDEENQENQVAEQKAQDIKAQHEIVDSHLKSYQKSTWVNFHALMIVGSLYISMVMTNWGAEDMSAKTFAEFKPNSLSMWVKLICAWLTGILYMWTCVVHRVFPQEEEPEQEPTAYDYFK